MKYYLLLKNLNKYEMIERTTNPYDVIADNTDSDWYMSVYFFDDEHKAKYEAILADYAANPDKYEKPPSGIAGLSGAKTDKLIFDFDNEADVEAARRDAVACVDRIRSHGVGPESFQICYSGFKGFSVIVKTDSTFTSKELKGLCTKIAGDLPTFDVKVYNDVRCLRLPLTRHQKTGHYKVPLSIDELNQLTVPEIQGRATDHDFLSQLSIEDLYMEPAELPASLLLVYERPVEKPAVEMSMDTSEIDWSLKPRWISNCKYALMKGYFKSGTRDHFLTVLAATFRTQFPDDKGMVYRMLKSVAENQANRNGTERKPDKDIYTKVEQVFKPSWQGGQFSCKNDDTLKSFCDSLGHHKCQHEVVEHSVHSMEELAGMFKNYANKIDEGTIKTGIEALDANVRIGSGMHVGLLGNPGAGKTSALLNILNFSSQAGVKSFFFSMDMYAPLVYQKQLQRLTGWTEAKILKAMEDNDPKLQDAVEQLNIDYENVRYSFKSGLSVEDIRTTVLQHQQDTGEKIKLIAIDYFECLSGPYADMFANSRIIAHKLKDLAAQDGFCVLTLVQPQKSAGDASTPLYSMRQVKGPSELEQGFGIIMGIYREGYSPNTSEDDRFITINSLKNRMGPAFKVDCAWNGLRGTIETLDDEGHRDLAAIRERKNNEPETRSSPFGSFGGR